MNRNLTIEEHGAFRRILDAIAHPGRVQKLSDKISDLDGAALLFSRTLLDPETGFAVASSVRSDLASQIERTSGCRLVDLEKADFVFVAKPGTDGALDRIRRGTPDWPDASATVVYLVEALHEEGGDRSWSGPGIPGARFPKTEGLDPREWDMLGEANSTYPLGVDCFFLDEHGQIMAMPRSTRLDGGNR
jgi:alpha-D-ribose 1-methylphosphonate 5-triphosphate synthase subunit PhnH